MKNKAGDVEKILKEKDKHGLRTFSDSIFYLIGFAASVVIDVCFNHYFYFVYSLYNAHSDYEHLNFISFEGTLCFNFDRLTFITEYAPLHLQFVFYNNYYC